MKKIIVLEEDEYRMLVRCKKEIVTQLFCEQKKIMDGLPHKTYQMGSIVYTEADRLKKLLTY